MENRLSRVRAYIDGIFDRICDAEAKRIAYIHCYGVSQCCALLAAKRGLDKELAAIIGLLHDIYTYRTGIATLHAPNGAEMVRVAFKHDLSGLFIDDEQTLIKSAIFHHSDKVLIHDEYDELLKDSDILQHYTFTNAFGRAYAIRLQHVMEELSLPNPNLTIIPDEEQPTETHTRTRIADIAEALASKHIPGEKANIDFMNIIRYYPEENAFDELINAWCAAFVYHCCMEAGFKLPIRATHNAKNTHLRLACVAAWYDWGIENGFCHYDTDGFTPERGDIVIYNNIIPPQDKPQDSLSRDHIGILIERDGNDLLIAEGNVGNKNVSGIMPRKRGNTIDCYIRIPDGFKYNGWQTDFKTGERRNTSYPVDNMR